MVNQININRYSSTSAKTLMQNGATVTHKLAPEIIRCVFSHMSSPTKGSQSNCPFIYISPFITMDISRSSTVSGQIKWFPISNLNLFFI